VELSRYGYRLTRGAPMVDCFDFPAENEIDRPVRQRTDNWGLFKLKLCAKKKKGA
jgi:hypothetical protein